MGTVEKKTVWQLWDCSDCGEKGISCEHNACTRCGHQRTFDEFEARYLPGNLSDDGTFTHAQREVTAAQASALRQAGVNWFCVVCQADNSGSVSSCHHCGAPRGATDDQLREGAGSFKTFEAYNDGDQGATAALVEQFGPYAGMRAAQGDSFQMEDLDHATQLKRAAAERDAFGRNLEGASRPRWDQAELPSSVESMKRTHQGAPRLEKKGQIGKIVLLGGGVVVGGGGLMGAGLVGLLLLSMGTQAVQGQVTQMHWEREARVERWSDIVRSGWQHEINPVTEIKPVKGRGERAGISLIASSCQERHWKDEQYQCGTKMVDCTHDVPDGVESYVCPQTESYPCSRTESYPCPETETYSCSKTTQVSCGEEEYGCAMRDNGNGSATEVCQTRTKYCDQTVSDTCTRTVPKTCTRTVDDTCTRTVPGTCTRTKYRKDHPGGDEVPKYCTRALQRPYCDYRTQEWREIQVYRSKGKGTRDIEWPDAPLKEVDRATRSARYTVTVSYQDNDQKPHKHSFEPGDVEAYRSWSKKDPVVLVVDRNGEVTPNGVHRGTLEEFEAKQRE